MTSAPPLVDITFLPANGPIIPCVTRAKQYVQVYLTNGLGTPDEAKVSIPGYSLRG